MPYKANESRRHRIPKARYRIQNWSAYDAALRRRGDLTIWVTPEAITAWTPASTSRRGRPRRYSEIAIEAGLMLRLAFGRPWRQTEGLLGSLMRLLGLDLPVPDHTTFSRRSADLTIAAALKADGAVNVVIDSTGLKVFGAGEWHLEKHGGKPRRSWRKLHLAVDPDTGEILASELTSSEEGDASLVGPLVEQIDRPLSAVLADGAYDGEPVYQAVAVHSPGAEVIIPPRSTAVPSDTAQSAPTQRDRHLQVISACGRLGWQKAVGYGRRSLVEVAMLRYKTLIGRSLRARTLRTQKVEATVGCKVMNIMIRLGMPISHKVL
ncbi:IS5 family transposase [Microvirga sp. VF16]|uniref:IS5 family transposase n=1 Tax=Microvirga sp. VF16 TaxID=2807101 RepID=UPI00193C9112|nr:IS5 family transposase [Microvirga sp. VF16]QRM35666.1 IS5 family transposase [Microvirga sp. VF16]